MITTTRLFVVLSCWIEINCGLSLFPEFIVGHLSPIPALLLLPVIFGESAYTILPDRSLCREK